MIMIGCLPYVRETESKYIYYLIVVNLVTTSHNHSTGTCSLKNYTLRCIVINVHRVYKRTTRKNPFISMFFCVRVQPKNDGVVMVNFYNNFVTCKNTATLSDVAGN